MNTRKDIVFGVAYFWAATFLTGIFIAQKFWLYNSEEAMVLSGSIAGAKWLIQIVGALILLEDKKWQFIRRIGYVCFIGSVLLYIYYVFNKKNKLCDSIILNG